jgi:tRNA (adenine57-N1/adenine58-N1)-methyltransferase
VGKPFGAKVYGKGEGKGFVWLLAPTPELWTKVLPHRTQILYAPDISLVAHALELKPGSVVLESGTGSASLTHALVRAVAPKGHVYTFEFNRARAEAANEEILQHGLASACTVSHRDVEKDGFPKCLENRCDAVFLDLPGPWKVIHSAAKSLRHDGVLCAFSPCIEQVQRTCEALEAHGFGDTQTVELLGRELDVETRDMQRSLKHAQPKLQNKWQREAKQKAKRKRAPGTGGGDGDGDGDGDDASELMRVVSYPRQQAQSHTGYLTFARLVPYATAEEAAVARAAGRAKRGRNGGGEENEDEFSE